MTAHEMARIREGLSPTFRLVSVLSRQVASQEEALVRLTDRQQEALEGLYANDRECWYRGPPALARRCWL